MSNIIPVKNKFQNKKSGASKAKWKQSSSLLFKI